LTVFLYGFHGMMAPIYAGIVPMKIAGFGLLLSGWLIAVAAPGMLPGALERCGFIMAGLLVQGLGLFLAGRGHRDIPRERA
jgi:hypothetical protein